ncbi:MAG: GHKL domain-containing protein [Gammaproteobacteria bacterium]|nr:MAG: GHKL domain-containing protein [Gammaproteobacteria bacterium]
MIFLHGVDQIRQLPERRQKRFERFYTQQTRYRILPLFADVSLAITFIGTLLFAAGMIVNPDSADTSATGLIVYTTVLAGLIVAHRRTRLRRASPAVVYLVYLHMAVFSYLGYIASQASLPAIVGLFFFISSIGVVTLSLRHTAIILTLNLTLLVIATSFAVPPSDLVAALGRVLSNWLILMCLIIPPLSAHYFRIFLRNLLALQFLLKDRNRLLSKTLTTLEATEDRLAQEQKHQALSLMAKGLLHEIMNPLNCASQAVDYATAINEDEEIGEALVDASLHQQRIAAIVSDLIEFAKPEPDHALDDADLSVIVATAQRICQHHLRGITVTLEIPANTRLSCYSSSMVQVFVNLLLNASAAIQNDHRHAPGRIRIKSQTLDNRLLVSVWDNGHGIESQAIQKLTDPFYSTNETPDNLGLGLSICQTIVRHHKGQLSITSEPQEWTEVTLELPQGDRQAA